LEELEATPSDLGAVVVGTGPGTFTGVRLGVATARAIALSLAVPVVGVSSLSALVAAALGDDPDGVHSVVVPSIDARRGEVFAAVYVAEPVRPETRGAAAGAPGRRWRRVGEVFVCPPEDVVDEVRRRVGIAAGSLEEVVHVVGAADGMQGEERGRYPQAACLVLGQELLREPGTAAAGDRLLPWLRTVLAGDAEAVGGLTPGSPGTPESVVPEYVRAPDADVHITKMRDPWAS
jgi:tRNA threonylcarbamoyl adenosine modification protein YeaZ